ncbi:MAG: hypothetical protein Q8P51_10185 [Ignavibacteria bacterium]|nr:hypothetical protein [Ignavibacteria bacterium]
MRSSILLSLFTLLCFSCSELSSPRPETDFNVHLRYGILARNEVNTFENTFTKDLILEGTITVPFYLSRDDLGSIEAKMEQIDFFSYPDTFAVNSQDSVQGIVTPNSTYDFKVRYHSTLKTLFWDDAIIASDPRAAKLRELILLIRNIIESKPEYKQLPPARGGYV